MRQRKWDVGWDLGLCQYIPTTPSSSLSSSSDATSCATEQKSHHHRVAILRDGWACTFDLTELQVRVILMLARRETESQDARSPVSPKSLPYGSTYYMWSPGGVSMKRSLQRFLQGRMSRSRRERAQEISPYNNRITTATATAAAAANHHRPDSDNNQN